MTGFEGLESMDLEKADDFSEDRKGNRSASCSICLDLVHDRGERSIAKLQCGHEFHLDCIGSAFNAKGAMQCPNCRKVEKGRWLYANGQRSSTDFDLDAWVAEDFYDFGYTELPYGLQWCPFRGITQLASLFEEGDSQLNSYHESFSNGTFGDHSRTRSTHVCPYLAFNGFPHAMHTAPPSGASDPVSENSTFTRHLNNLGGGQRSVEMPNSHSFTPTDPQNNNWQLHQTIPFPLLPNAADQSSSQYGSRVPRSDASSQQRLGSFMHPHSLSGFGPLNASNLVLGEMGGHGHTRGHGSDHIYQHSTPSSSVRSGPVPRPIRTSRPRGVTLISSLATNSPEVGGFYGFASVSGSANRGSQDVENMARHFDHQPYSGWGSRDGLAPFPWIAPQENDSLRWSAFDPNQAQRSGGSLRQRSNTSLGLPLPRVPPPRMPPPSYM